MKVKIYKSIILPVVLYGCETWSLTLKEECRLRVFEKQSRGEYYDPRGMRKKGGVQGSTIRNFIVNSYLSPDLSDGVLDEVFWGFPQM